jgi:hypothetical protein
MQAATREQKRLSGFGNTVLNVPQCGATRIAHLESGRPAMWQHGRAITFALPWHRERAELLQRLFVRVEERRKEGMSLDKALRRRWYGRRWHGAHRRKVRLGRARLGALFYFWSKNGRTPECLALRFASTLPPVPLETVQAFVRACAVPGVTKFSEAARLVDNGGVSFRRILSALPDRVWRSIRQSFRARRQGEIEARKLVNHLQVKMRRLLAADVTRSRQVNRQVEFL